MIYAYKCETCGKVIEKDMGMDEDHPQKIECPDCKTYTAYRHFSASFHIPYGWNDTKIDTGKKRNKKYF